MVLVLIYDGAPAIQSSFRVVMLIMDKRLIFVPIVFS